MLSVETWPSYGDTLTFADARDILNEAADAHPAWLTVSTDEEWSDGVPLTRDELGALRDDLAAKIIEVYDTERKTCIDGLRETPPVATGQVALPEKLAHVTTLKVAKSLANAVTGVILPLDEAHLADRGGPDGTSGESRYIDARRMFARCNESVT